MTRSHHRRTFLRTTTLAGVSLATCGKGFATQTPSLSPCDRRLARILRQYAESATLKGACVADRCNGDHSSGCLTATFSQNSQYVDFLKEASRSFDCLTVLSETDCHVIVDGRPYGITNGESAFRYGHDALSYDLSSESTRDPNGTLNNSKIERLIAPSSATDAFHDITRLLLDIEELGIRSDTQVAGWLEETLRARPSDNAVATLIADRLVEATAALVSTMSTGDWQDLLLGTLVGESLVMSGMESPVQLLSEARKLSSRYPDTSTASVWLAVLGAGRNDGGRVYRALASPDARMAQATREALSDAIAMSSGLNAMTGSGTETEINGVENNEIESGDQEISGENLVHYALGIDQEEFAHLGKPALNMLTDQDGDRHLRFSYQRHLTRTDVRFEVQRANDLKGPWRSDGIIDEAINTSGDFEFREARTPITEDDQLFMRLSIDRVNY